MTPDTRRLVLCHASVGPDRVVERLAQIEGGFSWLFLGEDYATRRRWEAALGRWGQRNEGGASLQRAAASLRRPFLDLMADLGRQHQSLAWWTSRVSERNVHVSPLFLNCCYAALAESVFEGSEQTLCIVATDPAVLQAVAARIDPTRAELVWASSLPRAGEPARRLLRIARAIAGFARVAMRRRSAPSLSGPRPHVVIRTWVDEACFGVDGFTDRYFGGLADWLTARGYQVATIPVLFNLARSRGEAWRALAATGRAFLSPESFYRARDYLFAMRVALAQAGISLGRVSLEGRDVTALFDSERRRSLLDAGALDAILSYRLPARLAEQGLEPAVFIDPYENMIPEKGLILGFRRYLPQTKLVGYQHSTVPPMLLCNFVTAAEAEFAPLPDRVVCSGALFRDVLVSEGLPEGLARVGPALRFAHLWTRHEQGRDADPSPSGLLVPLPLGVDPAVELLQRVIEALGPVPEVAVLVKPHPMLAISRVLSCAGIRELPEHFSTTTESMSSALARSFAVASFGSSALYEALAAGVPVLVVARESGLDLNPLAWYPELGEACGSPAQLRERVVRLRERAPGQREADRVLSERLREDFGPVNDETMQVFVEGLLEPGLSPSSER